MLNSWPYFDKEQIEAAMQVLQSGKVNCWQGNQTKLFEEEFARWCGTKYAIAVSNGSSALSLAYSAIGLSEGDEFITTARTFIATTLLRD